MHWNLKAAAELIGRRWGPVMVGLCFAVLWESPVGASVPTFDQWHAEGDAREWIDSRGSEGEQMTVLGFSGETLLNSYTAGHGDGSTGRLVSPEFTSDAPWLSFLIGGGNHPEETFIRLLVDGQAVRYATGLDSEVLSWHSWNVEEFAGEWVVIEIVDRATGQWGHILIDDIRMEDSSRMVSFANPEVDAAMGTLLRAIGHVANDPTRPRYHFHPPALWLNDPNGPFFANGWYHLFYQHNPYGDLWGPMHWGHARSRDLVTWEHLPIALAPQAEVGEGGVWSGTVAIRSDGMPMLFYTSIRRDRPANEYAEQNAAVPVDEDLTIWKRMEANPLLTPDLHGDVRVEEWRDPFLFDHDGRVFMVLAARVVRHGAGKVTAGVLLYEAHDGSLLDWKYHGVIHEQDLGGGILECPNLFELDGNGSLSSPLPAGPPNTTLAQWISRLRNSSPNTRADWITAFRTSTHPPRLSATRRSEGSCGDGFAVFRKGVGGMGCLACRACCLWTRMAGSIRSRSPSWSGFAPATRSVPCRLQRAGRVSHGGTCLGVVNSISRQG